MKISPKVNLWLGDYAKLCLLKQADNFFEGLLKFTGFFRAEGDGDKFAVFFERLIFCVDQLLPR